ncbi:Uncharacterized protein Fot_22716 [Forsythia ovata]|uniref:Uncharacterized protein n=1 Tax=Forsythia ovata TaxID=205694 RepID=A0ABD1UYH8_9LAMI
MLLENKLIHYHSLPVCLLPLPLPQFVNQSSRQPQQDPFSLAQSLFVGIQTVVGDHCQNSRPRLISFSILRLANRQAVVQCMADLISDKDVKSLRILKKRGFLRSAHCSVLALDALFWHWKADEEKCNYKSWDWGIEPVTPLFRIHTSGHLDKEPHFVKEPRDMWEKVPYA